MFVIERENISIHCHKYRDTLLSSDTVLKLYQHIKYRDISTLRLYTYICAIQFYSSLMLIEGFSFGKNSNSQCTLSYNIPLYRDTKVTIY